MTKCPACELERNPRTPKHRADVPVDSPSQHPTGYCFVCGPNHGKHRDQSVEPTS